MHYKGGQRLKTELQQAAEGVFGSLYNPKTKKVVIISLNAHSATMHRRDIERFHHCC